MVLIFIKSCVNHREPIRPNPSYSFIFVARREIAVAGKKIQKQFPANIKNIPPQYPGTSAGKISFHFTENCVSINKTIKIQELMKYPLLDCYI